MYKFKKRIYLSSPTMHGDEQKYIQEAFDTNWVAPLGTNVNEFENEMANFVGVKGASALVSGTAALHLALKLISIEQGDIVLCTDLTFAATVNPVSYEKAEQVFIDSELDTWNMDPEALKKAIQKYDGISNPKPKALILVHLYGVPAKTDEIKAICAENNIVLIEDAAESLGACYKGVQTGNFGYISALSFNGNKLITSSGGGMLLSNDEKVIDKSKFYATQARDNAAWYQHSEIGYNYRMSNIVAGIGRGQMPYISEHIRIKKRIYETYKTHLQGLPCELNPYLSYTEPNFWLSCILLNSNSKVKPMEIYNKLNEYNAESRPIWKPMHMQPVFSANDYIFSKNKNSEHIFNNGLCLPSDIKMTSDEQLNVIDIIKSMF